MRSCVGEDFVCCKALCTGEGLSKWQGRCLIGTPMTLCTPNLPLGHSLCPLLRENPLAFLLLALGNHANTGVTVRPYTAETKTGFCVLLTPGRGDPGRM